MAALLPAVIALCSDLDADYVKEIIDTDLTDAQINHFINIAYYQTVLLDGALDECGGDSVRCEIIALLAAHFLAMRDRRSKSESIAGEWSVTWQGTTGMGLDATDYGQAAKSLDCSGKLAKAGMKRATFEVIGENDSYNAGLDDIP